MARAHDARISLPVGIALDRAVTLAAAQVQTWVLDELLAPGRCWARLLRGFDRLRPLAQNHERAFQASGLVRATRATGRASLVALVRSALVYAVEVARDPGHPVRARRAAGEA